MKSFRKAALLAALSLAGCATQKPIVMQIDPAYETVLCHYTDKDGCQIFHGCDFILFQETGVPVDFIKQELSRGLPPVGMTRNYRVGEAIHLPMERDDKEHPLLPAYDQCGCPLYDTDAIVNRYQSQ